MVDQEKVPRPRQEAPGNLREPADRTVEEPHGRVAETREATSLCEFEGAVLGRKKHKSK